MRLAIEVESVMDPLGPWCEISLVEIDGGRKWSVASPPVNPKHAHLSAEELGVSILADALRKVLA